MYIQKLHSNDIIKFSNKKKREGYVQYYREELELCWVAEEKQNFQNSTQSILEKKFVSWLLSEVESSMTFDLAVAFKDIYIASSSASTFIYG